MGVYRIGWWRPWWRPMGGLVMGLLTGNQQSPRADNGSRFVGRRRFVAPLVRRARQARLPRRPWQAESDMFHMNAVRACTRRGAERKLRAAELRRGRDSLHDVFDGSSP